MTSINADQLVKQPTETRAYAIDFVNLLASGDSLASVTSGPTSTPTGLTFGSTAISGTQVQFTIAGGTAGTSYRVEVIVTTANGEIIEGDGDLIVAD